MRLECGMLLELLDLTEEPSGGPFAYSEYIPKIYGRCKKCSRMVPTWYPSPAPTIRLWQETECLVQIWHVPFVCHEALWDVIEPHWPDAVVTRCSSHPDSPLKIGERYVSLSLPRMYETTIRFPRGSTWQCEKCGRWVCSAGTGPYPDGRYVVLRPDQSDMGVFVQPSIGLLASQDVRRRIDRLGIGVLSWRSVLEFSEPLPHNRLPDDQPAQGGSQ